MFSEYIMQAFYDRATDAVSMIESIHPQHLFPYPSDQVSLPPQKFFHLNTPNIIQKLISLLIRQNSYCITMLQKKGVYMHKANFRIPVGSTSLASFMASEVAMS